MFCPEGYTTLAAIHDKFISGKLGYMLSVCKGMIKASTDNGMGYFYTISPADFVEQEMFRAIGSHVCIASPAGLVLRLDVRAVRSISDFWQFTARDLEDIQAKFPEEPKVPYHFWRAYRLFDFPPNEFFTEFSAFQLERPHADLWDFAETLGLDALHHQVPLLIERQGYTISMEAFDYLDKFDFIEMDEWRNLVAILRPFEGWAMCVPDSFAEGPDLKVAISDTSSKPERNFNQNGRPSHFRTLTQQAYERLYAGGHGATSWYVVLGKVNKESGLSVSLDTLKRAVAASKS